MELLVFWIVVSLIVAVGASNRGRSGFGWFLLSLLISPLLAGLFLLVTKNLAAEAAATAAGGEAPTPATHVRCPDCRELVRADARKCKHCNTTLVPQIATPEDEPGGLAYKGANRVGKVLADEFAARKAARTPADRGTD